MSGTEKRVLERSEMRSVPKIAGGFSGSKRIFDMQELVHERIRKLRQEIAEISAANKLHLLGGKSYTDATDHARRLQRLQEILDELMALTDWKKT